MKTCANGHEPCAFTSHECPACAARATIHLVTQPLIEIRRLQERLLKERADRIAELLARIAELEGRQQ
jgi:hypothetical protein